MLNFDFTNTLRGALKRTAEDIPEQTNLLPQIRQQITRSAPPQQRKMMFHQKRYRLAALLVAATLLISGFAYITPTVFQWLGDSSLQGITLDHATTINKQITVKGITLHVDQVYADAARTAITFHLSSTASSVPVPTYLVLTDTSGQIYPAIEGRSVNGEALAEFAPLASDTQSQVLTLTIRQMHLSNSGRGQLVAGIWQIRFPIIPLVGYSLPIASESLIHNGIAISPQRLDIAPSGTRLFVQISGLAPNTSQRALAQFAMSRMFQGTSPDGTGISSDAHSTGALLQLRLPNGQVLQPEWVYPVGLPDVTALGGPTPDQEVGATGKITLEVIFYTSLQGMKGSATLTMDHVNVSPLNGGTIPQISNGPWIFSIPL